MRLELRLIARDAQFFRRVLDLNGQFVDAWFDLGVCVFFVAKHDGRHDFEVLDFADSPDLDLIDVFVDGVCVASDLAVSQHNAFFLRLDFDGIGWDRSDTRQNDIALTDDLYFVHVEFLSSDKKWSAGNCASDQQILRCVLTNIKIIIFYLKHCAVACFGLSFSNPFLDRRTQTKEKKMPYVKITDTAVARFMDLLIEKLSLNNDAALSRKMKVAAPIISKLRSGATDFGAVYIIKVHKLTGMPIRDIESALGILDEFAA